MLPAQTIAIFHRRCSPMLLHCLCLPGASFDSLPQSPLREHVCGSTCICQVSFCLYHIPAISRKYHSPNPLRTLSCLRPFPRSTPPFCQPYENYTISYAYGSCYFLPGPRLFCASQFSLFYTIPLSEHVIPLPSLVWNSLPSGPSVCRPA